MVYDKRDSRARSVRCASARPAAPSAALTSTIAALLLIVWLPGSGAAQSPGTSGSPPQAPADGPQVRAGRDGFSIRSGDGAFQLRLRGYMQSDSRFFLDDHQNATDAFLLRRVRPIVEGTLFRQFDFRVMPDFGGGATVLQDAYIEARFHPLVRIRTGKFKPPVGLERLTSAAELLFIERALPTSLVPNRDVGIAVHGDWKTGALTYMGGLFNGAVDGGSTDGDDHDGKDVAGRVFAHPFRTDGRTWLRGLGVGIAGSYGVQRGTRLATALPVMRTSGQLTFFRFRTDGTDTGTVVADGARSRISAQGYYYVAGTGLVVEHVLSSQAIRRSTSTLNARSTAWQIAASQVVTGEKAAPRGVTPARAFDRAAGHWGALELAARYSTLSVDDEAFPFFADPAASARRARAAAVGLNWYLNANVKISADYERTAFSGGAPAGERAVEHDLFTRFQIAF